MEYKNYKDTLEEQHKQGRLKRARQKLLLALILIRDQKRQAVRQSRNKRPDWGSW